METMAGSVLALGTTTAAADRLRTSVAGEAIVL